MNFSIAAVVPIFSIFYCIYSPSFLVQFSEAAGENGMNHHHHDVSGYIPNLDELVKMSREFNRFMIVPIVRKCADDKHFQFDPVKDLVTALQKEWLCIYVKMLNEMQLKLNKEHGEHKKAANGIWSDQGNAKIDTILDEIHELIVSDMASLRQDYQGLLGKEALAHVVQEVTGIAEARPNSDDWWAFERENMNSAFLVTFRQLETAVKNNPERDRVPGDMSQQMAYELLCIGEKMQHLFQKSREEKLEWAFQQFAVNLSIYALSLDQQATTSDDEHTTEIGEIAANWKIGMKMEGSKLMENSYDKRFF